MGENDKTLYAYRVDERTADMPLTCAAVDRDWMDGSHLHFAYRCLPLSLANQAGWVIGNPAGFTAWWYGGLEKDRIVIELDAGCETKGVWSHFGSGTITFVIPYLFQTPRGVNLWVKGPTNWIKDGAQALEGIVETDWLPFTFTMNWKLTRTHFPVRFEAGEPICMVVPVARGLAEGLEPVCPPIESNPELARQFNDWSRDRSQFLSELQKRKPDAVERGWQKDYTKGIMPDGTRFPEHQTRLQLKEFTHLPRPDASEPLAARRSA